MEQFDNPTHSPAEEIEQLKFQLEQQAQLAAIVESAHDAIIGEDLSGNITNWNDGAAHLFGYSAQEVIGLSVTILAPEERTIETHQFLERLNRGERIEHFETVRLHKSGQKIFVSLTLSPIRGKDGRLIGASKIVRDISAQRGVEEDLRKAKETAENVNQAKDHFLAILSHELRTPLTPTLATATAMENDARVPGWMRDDIRMIRRNVELEARLIDDLLDLTRIARGKIELQCEITDAHKLIESVLGICRGEMLGKQVQIAMRLDAANSLVFADPARLLQIIWNLVKNAIKFTPGGGKVEIITRNENEKLILEVRDTGIGILPEMRKRIFNAFEQGEQSVTREFGGLGLGLALSKSLVEMHYGQISVHSGGRDQGSTFQICLPVADRVEQAKKDPQAVPAAGENGGMLNILLVEDHVDTAKTLGRLLQSLGHCVKVENTVRGALQAAQVHEFDLLISDIGLPDASGLDLVRKLQEKQPILAIALSGFGMEEDIKKSREAGFSIHLTKPINFQKLQALVDGIASRGKVGVA